MWITRTRSEERRCFFQSMAFGALCIGILMAIMILA